MVEVPPPYGQPVLTCSVCGRQVEADPAEEEAAAELERTFGLARPAFICEDCAERALNG